MAVVVAMMGLVGRDENERKENHTDGQTHKHSSLI